MKCPNERGDASSQVPTDAEIRKLLKARMSLVHLLMIPSRSQVMTTS